MQKKIQAEQNTKVSRKSHLITFFALGLIKSTNFSVFFLQIERGRYIDSHLCVAVGGVMHMKSLVLRGTEQAIWMISPIRTCHTQAERDKIHLWVGSSFSYCCPPCLVGGNNINS